MALNDMLHLGPAAGGDRATLEGAIYQANRFPQLPAVILSPRPEKLVAYAKKRGIVAELRKTTRGHVVVHVPPQEAR